MGHSIIGIYVIYVNTIIKTCIFIEYSQYYDPTSMIMTTGEIASHNNPNEMTSEISTIAPDLTLMAEPEKSISTEPKFGFFDRQMAELEPKVC